MVECELVFSLSWFKMKLLFIVLILNIFLSYSCATTPHRRFEYKYSFKPPYLAQKDGTVPFWEYGGNAIASAENVRIAPSLRSQKGAIWTKSQTNFEWWEVEIVFRITGRGRIGADGLAFWYSEKKGDYNGEVFGSSDQWNGLGVFFDSFDNDNKHNNPYIMAVVNDGTRKFDHQNDGTTQLLAGCLRDFRNKPFPTRARIEYFQNTLTVLFHNGMTNNDADFEVCLRAENVFLPRAGHFGLSAATGGLADDHDVLHFLTTSLHVGKMADGSMAPQTPEADQAKLSQEYLDYQKKVEQQKEEYRRDHPDQVTKDREAEMEDWFESDSQRELRQIFQGQSVMSDGIRELSRKLDEVIGRQERTLGLLSVGHQQIPGQVPSQVPVQGSGSIPDTIRRHEVEAVLNNQNILVNAAREIRTIIGEVHARADLILGNQARQPTAQIQGGPSYDMQALIAEMRDNLNNVKLGVAGVAQRLASQPSAQASCPTQTCLSLTAFLIATVVQLGIVLAYSIYRESKEQQAKKFY